MENLSKICIIDIAMDNNTLLTEKFAHELLPRLCFVHANRLFSELQRREAQEYAQHLWDELARALQLGSRAGKVKGKRVDLEDGLMIFLVRFPVQAGERGPLGAAVVFRYRPLESGHDVQESHYFTLEKDDGQVVCNRWEDAPTRYLWAGGVVIPDASERSFLKAIHAYVNGRVNSEPGWDFSYEHWKARLHARVDDEIRAAVHPAQAALQALCAAIGREHAGLAQPIQEIEQHGSEEFYRSCVMSFAVGFLFKGDYGTCVTQAKSVDDLPSELRLIHNQGISLVGALLGDLVELLHSHGYVFQEGWNALCHDIYVALREAQIRCLVIGSQVKDL